MWPRGQAVKTSPFHGGIMGSIPVGVTKKQVFTNGNRHCKVSFFLL